MPDLKKYRKYAAGALVAVAAALSLMIHFRGKNPAWVRYESMVERFETVRQVEFSELDGLLEKVVKDRFDCYATIAGYEKRLLKCRKQYMNKILEIARNNIKSSPSLGEYMLCVRDCPLAYSMCRGVDEDDVYDPMECIEVEIQCVEWCLDTFWRGDGLKEKK